MILCYSGKSRPSAERIAEQDDSIRLNRGSQGDINFGRNRANTKLNPDISNTTNKRVMRELFAEHGVPTPTLYTVEQLIRHFSDSYGRQFIGRPDTHSKGRGLWKVSNRLQLQRALRGTRKKKAATHFMEYIDHDRAPREYRVHIFKGKSIRISEKDFTDASRKEYTTARPDRDNHNIRHVRQAAKDAVAAVGLDFGTVDVLANDEECWVLEVNSAPGLGGSMPRVYAETFKKWYEEQQSCGE